MKGQYGVLLCCLLTLIGCNQAVENQVEENELELNREPEQGELEMEHKQEEIDELDLEEEIEIDIEEDDYYRVNDANWSIEPIEDGNEQVILLTIDDAPDQYTLEMAETLDELGVRAIFFVNGHLLNDAGQEVVKKLYDMGFEIGNHTMNHPNMSERTEEEQRAEIIELNDMIYEITGEYPRFYRAPFGANTEYSNELMDELAMTRMNWTYGYDWEPDYRDPESLADIMVNAPQLQNGANLLMHDRPWTAEALEKIVHGLQEKGYEFVNPKKIKTE